MSSKVMTRMSRRADALPAWTSVLAVVAHPDDESFGLGALLDAFARSGAGVEVLCLTHGEASTLHGAPGDLASLRGAELAAAADVLGVTRAMLKDHPDGDLSGLPDGMLVAEAVAAGDSSHADGVLVFDTAGVTGHPSGVEDQHPISMGGVTRRDRLGDQHPVWQPAQVPVRVVLQHGPGHAEHIGSGSELSPPQGGEVSRGSVQRRCLAMGQAQP